MANTVITQDQIIWTPQPSDAPLYYDGPSHNGYIKQGDDSSAQLFNMGMGSICFFGVNQKINFSIKIGSAVQYQTSTFTPKVYIDRNGRIKLRGTGSIGGNSITAEHYMSGKNDGKNAYIVLNLTNNTGSTITATPTLIWAQGNMQNYRWQDTGNADTDSISWDSTNKFMQITTPAISNLYAGIRACTTVQHYRAQTSFVDINSTYLGAGDLPDTIGTLGTENYIFIQHGATASQTNITAGSTVSFAWAVGWDTTLAALQSTMAALTSTPSSDLSTADGYLTPTKIKLDTSGAQWLVDLFDISLNRLGFIANSQKISGKQSFPAGSYTFIHPFGRDGYYSVKAGLQTGLSAIVSDEVALFKANQGSGYQQHEIGYYSNASGIYTNASNNGTPGDQDPYQILKAYEYYIATQDSTFLTNNLLYLNGIADYLITYYNSNKDSYGIFAGAGASTYPDGAGNVSGANPVVDPVLASTVAYSIKRLGELNTAANLSIIRTNQIPNPSFELAYNAGSPAWVTYGTFDSIARDNTSAARGTYSSKHINSTAKDGGLSITFSLAAGTYTVGFDANITAGTSNASALARNAGGFLNGFTGNSWYTAGQWKRYTFTFTTATTGNVDILLGMGSYGSASSGTVAYDGVTLETGTTDGSYYDGSSTSYGGYIYTWTGAVNASTSQATFYSPNHAPYYSTTIYSQMTQNFSSLWNSSANWPYMNRKPTDNTLYTNKHLPKVDAAVWGVLDPSYCNLMATELVDTTNWWDSSVYSFKEMPSTDPLYDGSSYWYGPGWNLTDFKALELVFRYGTVAQAQKAWGYLQSLCQSRLDIVKGFMAEKNNNAGLFGFSIGAMTEMILRGIFGIDMHASYFTISPNTWKLGMYNTNFKLSNLKMGNQLYTITIQGGGPNAQVYVNNTLTTGNIPYSSSTTINVYMIGRSNY